MSRQAVDLVLYLPWHSRNVEKKAAKQSAWLRVTRVPLRSIKFNASRLNALSHIVEQEQACEELALSERTLASSETTLKVLTTLTNVIGCRPLCLHLRVPAAMTTQLC